MKRFAKAAALAAALAAGMAWGAPGRPVMTTPGSEYMMDRRPVFRWTPAADTTKYLLSITRNSQPYLEKWTRKTSWAPLFDLPEGVYEARVIAYDGAVYGHWSRLVRIRRVFGPAISAINGVGKDGANITLQAGSGIAIEPDASNLTVIISSTGITATQIIDSAVTTVKIENYAITESKLADGSVTEPKIATGAVTETKLADGAVTSNKLAAGSVRMANLQSGGASSGQVLKWNGGAWGPATILKGYSEGAIGVGPLALGAGSVALGEANEAKGSLGAILGGHFNIIEPDVYCSVIAGGADNLISSNALYSTIVGGRKNTVTKYYSLAAGRQASATNEGAFVWSDSTGVGAGSWGPNTVLFQANGGVRFQSTTPDLLTDQRVQWVPGSAAWAFSSDRNLKEGFEPVDARAVLAKVAGLPITTWRFKGYNRTHIGTMAQDFHAAFPFEGAEETMVDSSDLQGVTLSALQGLYGELQAEKARNDALEARLRKLEERLGF
ncbi:MAG: tail fiber domain-containing protein [Kiritimatiellia bacterium]